MWNLISPSTETPLYILLFGALLLATITDIRRRKIPNYITFTTALLAFVMHAWLGGLSGLGASLLAFAVWFALGFAFYAIGPGRGIGGGDIKLIMAIGALCGFYPCLCMAFASFLLQTLYLIGRWIFAGTAGVNLVRLKNWFKTLLYPHTWKMNFVSHGTQDRSPHGPFLLIGCATVVVLNHLGYIHYSTTLP